MILEGNIGSIKDKNYVTMTHEKVEDLFSIVDGIEFTSLRYYPSMEEIEIMKTNIHKYYAFILWLLSNPIGPETKAEERSEKELNRIIMNYTKLRKMNTLSRDKHFR